MALFTFTSTSLADIHIPVASSHSFSNPYQPLRKDQDEPAMMIQMTNEALAQYCMDDFLTLSPVRHHTFSWKKSSNFFLASTPTSLIIWPPFPTTMPFCESLSTNIVAFIRIVGFFSSGFGSLNSVTRTSQQYGISFLSFSNKVARIISDAKNLCTWNENIR